MARELRDTDDELLRDYVSALWPLRQSSGPLTNRPAQILDLAAQMFYGKGYASTTMREIANGAGLLKGSLYHHFSSKEEILFHIMWTVHTGLTAVMAPVRASDAPPWEKLRAIVRGHTLYNAKNIAWTTVFYNDFGALSDERRALIIEQRDRYDAMLLDLIERAQSDGFLSSQIPAKLVLFGMTGLVNSLHRWFRPEGEYSAEEVADAFAALALDGLATDAATLGSVGS